MNFEWDENKEQINIKKHGLDFRTAALVFNDKHCIKKYDAEHSIYEDRYIIIGKIKNVIMVVYTERKNAVRIISARKATKKEKEEYIRQREGISW